MGGIIGRLFREFAVTLAMAIFVSMVVSLTLTPMMASRFLKAHSAGGQHGRLYLWSERCFDALLRAYERGLDLVLRWRLTTLMVFFATVALSGYLFVVIPKGFFPQQDTGLITAHYRSGAGRFLRRDDAHSGADRRRSCRPIPMSPASRWRSAAAAMR